MIQIKKKILVTCALPYANGPLHLGHMLEHIQADIWVRYQRMRGHKVYFICADDAHGAPIMLKAMQLNIAPEEMIKQINLDHQKDLIKFNISYDNYHSTHSEENRYFSNLIYQRLKKNGYIKLKSISQLFDPKQFMFLPDRFVKGNCPECFSQDQYGDNCEICGATYNPTDLINPKSAISGATPEIRESEHFFFDLPAFRSMLLSWTQSDVLHKQVYNKVQEWFKAGLQPWDISRDAPYFGFKIPDSPDKYFYVWLDAPIGYIGTFKNLCQKRNNLSFKEFWDVNTTTELCHFIGKDIVYFHSIFWPAILEGSQFRKPTNLFVHGYVTVNGTKMSKSRGTFIKASTYLSYLDSDCLRYYYAAKLSSHINDIDLNLKDFVHKVNTDVVNKVVNLAARTSSFISKYFNGQLSPIVADPVLYSTFVSAAPLIGEDFNNRETSRAIKKIIALADLANRYIDKQAPWIVAKQSGREVVLQNICSMGIQLFRILIIYLKPILPSLAKRAEDFLALSLTWNSIFTPISSHRICPFKSMFSRIELAQVNAMIEASRQENRKV